MVDRIGQGGEIVADVHGAEGAEHQCDQAQTAERDPAHRFQGREHAGGGQRVPVRRQDEDEHQYELQRDEILAAMAFERL